jgi:CheY-like chemotaxis protein
MLTEGTLPVILMLEHDADDRFITSHIFEENKYPAHIEFVNNSADVFLYLSACKERRQHYPAMILINLHTAPLDGREILKQLKAVPEYRHIPVVILSGSTDAAIAQECYALGASSYIQKPALLSETKKKVENFFRYWFQTVVLS